MAQSAVGFSFGNTNAAVAVAKEGSAADVIANDLGERTTPCMIGYDGEEVNVGLTALQGVVRNGKNTVTKFYELIGRKFADAEVQAGLGNRACKVVDKEGQAWCEPECKEGTPVDPQELATMIFNDLKTTASSQVGSDVVKAVLAIKPGTTDDQKAGLKAAASAAGITIEQFIPEPVAAVLAYDLGQETTTDHTVVVYDLGALAATVTLVSVRSGVYRILGSVTDGAVGGEVVDTAMVEFLKKEFKKKTKMDVGDNVKANAKLLEAAVHAKKILSTGSSTALVSIESLIDGMDFQCKVMGARVNVQLSKVYRQCVGAIEKLLAECGIAVGDVTDVVLAGGGARAKKVQSTLAGFFANPETGEATAKILDSMPSDEVVAIGAAKQALVLTDLGEESVQSELKLKILTRDIAVKGGDGVLVTVLSAGTPIPVARVTTLSTSADNQTSFTVEFVEKAASTASGGGDDAAAAPLAKATLSDLPAKPAGEVTVSIRAEVSKGGDLRIHVSEESSGKEISGVVPRNA